MRFKRLEIDRESLLREIRDMAAAGTLKKQSARGMLEALGWSRWNARSLSKTERGYVEEISAKYGLTRPERVITAGWLRGVSRAAQNNLKSLMAGYIAWEVTPENAFDPEPILSEQFVTSVYLILFKIGYFRDALTCKPPHTQYDVAWWFLRISGYGNADNLDYRALQLKNRAPTNQIPKETKTHDFFCDFEREWQRIFDYAMGVQFKAICDGLGIKPTSKKNKILKDIIKGIRAGHGNKYPPKTVIKPLLKYLEAAYLKTYTFAPDENSEKARAKIELLRDELQRYLDSIGGK